MAITGSGIESDPYIVHSYDEIKTCIETMYAGSKQFIKLGNSINCNDYESSFTWRSINRPNYGGYQMEFDLDGNTIKNFILPSGSNVGMFYMAGGSTILKNGKILNVFSEGADRFCDGVTFKNMQISINMSGLAGTNLFAGCNLDGCAVYIEGNAISGKHLFSGETNHYFKNSDIKIMLTNVSTGTCVFFNNAQLTYTINGIRLAGKMTPSGTPVADYYLTMRNEMWYSVIDVDFSAFDGVSNSCPLIHGPSGTSAWNIENVPLNMQGQTAIKCNSQEIRNGDSLRDKGFNVINVSA